MFQAGKTYVCTNSQSNAYKLGRTYKCFSGDDKGLYLMGDDGIKDNVHRLLSKFKVADE